MTIDMRDYDVTGHRHLYRGVGFDIVRMPRKDYKPPELGVMSIDLGTSDLRCIVRACDCGDWYYQPIDLEDNDRIRPYPEWAS